MRTENSNQKGLKLQLQKSRSFIVEKKWSAMFSSSLGVLQTMYKMTMTARVREDFLDIFVEFFLPPFRNDFIFLDNLMPYSALILLLETLGVEHGVFFLIEMEMKILRRMR